MFGREPRLAPGFFFGIWIGFLSRRTPEKRSNEKADLFEYDNESNGKTKAKAKQKQNAGFFASLRMTSKRSGKQQRRLLGEMVYIPPIAKCAMDGAPVVPWLAKEELALWYELVSG